MTHPNPSRRTLPARGSTLLMVTVLLGVLAAVGVASVTLGSRERINASAKGRRDAMSACANAARLVIWAEVAKFGSARLRDPLTEARITLSDGTLLSAPAHYSTDDVPQVVNLRSYDTPLGAAGGTFDIGTNSILGLEGAIGQGGRAYAFAARCRDALGREIEVEFTSAFVF